jgi:hypothetical protein
VESGLGLGAASLRPRCGLGAAFYFYFVELLLLLRRTFTSGLMEGSFEVSRIVGLYCNTAVYLGLLLLLRRHLDSWNLGSGFG